MSEPKTPLLTVDIIIALTDRPGRPIVLIERLNPPYGWALPGGFVDRGERLETAAVREAMEETSLKVALIKLLGCYSDPNRDPRGHTTSAVYIAESTGQPIARDDAKTVKIVSCDSIPDKLVFDHSLIVSDYLKFLQNKTDTPLRFS